MKKFTLIIIFAFFSCITSEASLSVAQTAAQTTEDEVYSHYLDKIFGIESRFHSLPKDVQYMILSYLPNPFRPVRPRKVREIKHDGLKLGYCCDPTLCKSGKEVIIFSRATFFLEALDGSYRSEPVSFTFRIHSYAFNNDHSKMVIISVDHIHEITLNNYAVVSMNSINSPDVEQFYHAKAQYIPDGSIIIATSRKEIFRWDPTTPTIEKLTETRAVEGAGERRTLDYCIHPKGHNVIYCEGSFNTADRKGPPLEVFTIENKKWKTLGTDALNLSGKTSKIAYNSDGSMLLVNDETASYYYHKAHEEDKYTIPRAMGRCFTLLRVYDLTGDKPKEIGKPIPARNTGKQNADNFAYAGFTQNDRYIYAKTSRSGTNFIEIYSINKRNCLLELPEACNICLVDDTGQYCIAIGPVTGSYSPHIWQTNPSWMSHNSFVGRPNTLREYLLMAYLHSLGAYGITLDKNGLRPQIQYKERISSVEKGPQDEELNQIVETYNSLEPIVRSYFHNNYDSFDELEESMADSEAFTADTEPFMVELAIPIADLGSPKTNQEAPAAKLATPMSDPAASMFENVKTLKLLTFLAILAYTGSIMKEKYSSKKGSTSGSDFLGDFLLNVNNIENKENS